MMRPKTTTRPVHPAVKRKGPGVAWSGCIVVAFVASVLVSCASGKHWVKEPLRSDDRSTGLRLLDGGSPKEPADNRRDRGHNQRSDWSDESSPELSQEDYADAEGVRPGLRLKGEKRIEMKGPVDGRLLGVFRNTYYDFPAEISFGGDQTKLMNPSCEPIATVRRNFFEALCVQGSGTLVTGQTVSFSKRDCACAEVCPRTGQKICFDALDQQKFPWGRGARGTAIVPLRTVAVDSTVIPLGTKLYISEYDGVPRSPGGTRHDGCFIAEDRGMKVVGEHVDVFTGNPSTTQHLNQLVPSNEGVHVYLDTARCN